VKPAAKGTVGDLFSAVTDNICTVIHNFEAKLHFYRWTACDMAPSGCRR